MHKYFSFFLLLILAACSSSAQAPTSQAASTPASSTATLTPPDTVTNAILANFRPLTTTGLATGPLWSPKSAGPSESLAYATLSYAPRQFDYQYSNRLPSAQAWLSGPAAKNLIDGTPVAFSPDGSLLYVMQLQTETGSYNLWDYSLKDGSTHKLLELGSYQVTHQLADGRLVLSQWGTTASLRIYDPASGKSRDLMSAHPSSEPETARLSPDGSLLAYPSGKTMYLVGQDGASPKKLFDDSGSNARVWWSPDSQHMVFITGATQSDRLILADRTGESQRALLNSQGEVGYISGVTWSPDSRWLLVLAQAASSQESFLSKVFLFDTIGDSKLILTNYLLSVPVWSPDGHTLAISFWNGPEAEQPEYNIWLADLADARAVAAAPSRFPTPAELQILPSPTPVLPPASLSAEGVLRGFWAAVNQKEYRQAYSVFTIKKRSQVPYVEFRAFYTCFASTTVKDIQPASADDLSSTFSIQLDFQEDPACNNGLWKQDSRFYAILVRDSAANPWLISCFNSTANCKSSQ